MAAGRALLTLDAWRSASWGLLGLGAVVAATAAWALDNTLTRPLAERDPLEVVAAKGIPGGAATLAGAFVTREDAIADTWTGDLAWNPGRCDLFEHLCGAIRRRTFDEAERASVSASGHRQRGRPRRLARARRARGVPRASAGAGADDELAAVIANVAAELRLLVSPDDVPVMAILDAWAAGLTETLAVLRRGRLTAPAYRSARARIHRVVPELPVELRTAVISLLRRAS